MRGGRASILGLATILALIVPGCRLARWDGPVPRALAASRQQTQLGVAALEREDWEEAERLLSQAVRACPIDTEARRHYAEALWKRGLQQKAIAQLEEANRLTGEDPTLDVLIAEMRLAMGQRVVARRIVQRAIDLDPTLASAWAIRAKIALEEGDAEQALADYHHALGLAPEDREVKLAIAELHRRLNQPQRALAMLHNLTETYSPGEEPAEVFFLQGLAYGALSRYDDAAECFAAAAGRDANSPEIFFRLAEAQWLAGRPESAAAAAQEALALDPGHPSARLLLERIHVALHSEGLSRR